MNSLSPSTSLSFSPTSQIVSTTHSCPSSLRTGEAASTAVGLTGSNSDINPESVFLCTASNWLVCGVVVDERGYVTLWEGAWSLRGGEGLDMRPGFLRGGGGLGPFDIGCSFGITATETGCEITFLLGLN